MYFVKKNINLIIAINALEKEINISTYNIIIYFNELLNLKLFI